MSSTTTSLRNAAVLTVLLALAPLARAAADNLPPMNTVPFEELNAPTSPGSGEAALVAAGETVYLQWLESGAHPVLRLVSWKPPLGWTAPTTVAADPRLMISWADCPQLLPYSDSLLASSWMRKVAGKDDSYDVFVSTSADGGRTWGEPRMPHKDTKRGEHGFVSLVRNTSSTFNCIWLDGRNVTMQGPKKTPSGSMQLRLATWMPGGVFGPEQLLDPRVCDCCQTGAARTLEGIVVAYRDRSDKEIRDISSVRFDRGLWLAPTNVYADNWKISGCPINGPSVAASGTNMLAVAWFSDLNDSSQVKVALSTDGGVSYNRVVRVDGGHPLGRVATERLPDDSFAVAWLEQVGTGAELRVRRILQDGSLDAPVVATSTKINRESGFPRLAWSGVSLFVAWTDLSEPSGRVHVGRYDWSKSTASK